MGLAQSKSIHKVTDSGLSRSKYVEELPTAAFSNCIERIGRRRSSRHKAPSYAYIGMCQLPSEPRVITAECPAKLSPLGGGVLNEVGQHGANIQSSFPAKRGWEVVLDNNSSGTGELIASVVCAE